MNVEERIVGQEKLTTVFGRWPSFHDSEVLGIHLDRTHFGDGHGPTLDALIHVFEMTSEISPSGFYVSRNHSLAHFRFHDVVELNLEGFNHQNVLSELAISDIQERQMERIISRSISCHHSV